MVQTPTLCANILGDGERAVVRGVCDVARGVRVGVFAVAAALRGVAFPVLTTDLATFGFVGAGDSGRPGTRRWAAVGTAARGVHMRGETSRKESTPMGSSSIEQDAVRLRAKKTHIRIGVETNT